MTVDEALKIVAQERLDVMAEGMSADECSQIAAYVLHDAVLKDRKYIALLQDLRMQENNEKKVVEVYCAVARADSHGAALYAATVEGRRLGLSDSAVKHLIG